MHLTAKFHHPTFNRSEVIVLTDKQTNWQTDKQTPLKTPRSAVLRRWVNIIYLMCLILFILTAD